MCDEYRGNGNKDGNYVHMVKHESNDPDDDLVDIEIGHCCVVTQCIRIPVTILSQLLTTALDDFDPTKTGWPKEYQDKLVGMTQKIKYVGDPLCKEEKSTEAELFPITMPLMKMKSK